MKKNLINKMINSRMQKDKQSQSGTWLYSADGVQGYMTQDGEFLDMRPKVNNDDEGINKAVDEFMKKGE